MWAPLGSNNGVLFHPTTTTPSSATPADCTPVSIGLSVAYVESLGSRLLALLLAIRHPGAMDTLFAAMTAVCGRLLQSGDESFCSVPSRWLER